MSKSSKKFKPGDVILRIDEPLVYVSKNDHRMFTCDRCFKSIGSSLACSLCKKVYYCSKECLKDSYEKIHRLECPILARQKPQQFENDGIDFMQRLALRLYLLLLSDESLQMKEFRLDHNGSVRTIKQMESHNNELKDSDRFKGILNYFHFYKIENFNLDLLLRCYGLLQINSFGIDCYDATTQTIDHRGCGLYVEASVFDHSCVPNACASGDGLVLEIRALRPIEIGEEIFIDYVQDVLARKERNMILEDRYFFTCQCEFGCDPKLYEPFDNEIDFKRYEVLNNLILTLASKDHSERDTKRLLQLYQQRLAIQERFYQRCRYHPCLSLFYQCFLRFLILNHEQLDDVEPLINRITMIVREHLSITHGKDHPFYQWSTNGNQ
ncbi:Set and mynd domain-containing protein-like protein [Sarcoptes scabiei]|uniref:Set and mynd domain-containing protein-like protein n=1 Tax=Sarcoptes scabiei TaxID=52283 RepID=A0A132A4G8_SARSC|nr:Set and mynd domain-containing protein-like protein [Sarcoptes scabiei]